jgi:Icc-related predicted phosphoesterase
MKILTISDHIEPTLYKDYNPALFQDIDLILSCGDLPPEYLSFISSRINSPLYYVKGNHDIRYDEKPPEGCIDINLRLICFKNLKIIGFEGSRWYNGNKNQYTDFQMKMKIFKIIPRVWWSKGVDIIISHAPPRYVGDAEDLCHRGFKSFHHLFNLFSPKYFIHGHIHAHFKNPSDRIRIVKNTRVINTVGHFLLEIDEK